MGSNFACVSCHGEDGRGGQHVMHMDVMDAPDIRIAALSASVGIGGVLRTQSLNSWIRESIRCFTSEFFSSSICFRSCCMVVGDYK